MIDQRRAPPSPGNFHAIEQSLPDRRDRSHVGHLRAGSCAVALSAAEPAHVPQYGQLRCLAPGFPQGGPRQRHLAGHCRRRPGRNDHGPRRHRPRSQARLLCPELPRLLRQADFPEPHPERHRPPETAPRPVRQGREAIRRARSRDRGLLGPGDRLWVRSRQAARPARARHPGLRLPSPRYVPRRVHGCSAHHRSRRPDGRGDDRLVGRRTRADPVPAFALPQARDRLRRRRPAQSDHERPRCHRILRQFHCSPRLEARPALARGGACARQSRLGPGRSHHSTPARKMGRVGRDAGRRQARLPPTPFPPRSSCPWAATVPRSSPTRIFRST